MPIYEYRCTACGHEQEFLRKVSDPALTICPKCSKDAFVKKLTAAGFQLKGSGWYATDFKNGSAPKPAEGKKDEKAGSKEESSKSESASPAPSPTPAPSPPPAAS